MQINNLTRWHLSVSALGLGFSLDTASRRMLTNSIAGGLLGILAGLGLEALIATSEQRLDIQQLANQYLARTDEIIDEADHALEAITLSSAPRCSDDELNELRKLVVNSRFLKSGAFLDGDVMPCNSLVGRFANPVTVPPPNFITLHGRGIYVNQELSGVPSTQAVILRKGEATVVLSNSAFTTPADPRMDFQLVMDVIGDEWATLSSTSAKPFPVSGKLVTGVSQEFEGNRYEVACAQRHEQCVIARFKDDRLEMHPGLIAAFMLLGAVAGIASGIGLAMWQAHASSLTQRLRAALRAHEITLVYQPIIRLSDRSVLGFEALSRWRTVDGQDIRPDLFVAAAEEGGFIVEFTQYVLRRALEEMAPILAREPGLYLTVNVAAEDLQSPSFLTFVTDACELYGVPPHCLGFEITERSTVERSDLKTGINALRAAGHRVYIDDFGVDYSNLSYLVDLQVDAVKLDRTFASNVSGAGKGRIISAQIAKMAAELNVFMVIEGIETAAQAKYFTALPGTICGQGWLFERPMSVGRVAGWLQRKRGDEIAPPFRA